MGLKDFFKSKKKVGFPEKKELEIPPAPPTKEELPSFPSPEEIPEVKEEKAPSVVEKREGYAIKTQQEELEEREDLTLRKPIFVYLDMYKEMINEIGLTLTTLKESSDSLARVAEFKEDEDKEFNKWGTQIKDIQRKLTYADKTLFK